MTNINPPKSILCVCLGNICRSPTAEAVFRYKLQQSSLSILVDSAGTGGWHLGCSPDPRSQQHAKARGYDLSSLLARQIQTQDFYQFDLILAMDKKNLLDLQQMQSTLAKQDNKIANLAMLSQMDLNYQNQSVPDPYYKTDSCFEQVLDRIESHVNAWINHWQGEK